ncbi:MAG: hypothetical protein NTZ39_03120 [Methanoregula sp.]|nr:hypothetical protein [Methanoregula sp.]
MRSIAVAVVTGILLIAIVFCTGCIVAKNPFSASPPTTTPAPSPTLSLSPSPSPAMVPVTESTLSAPVANQALASSMGIDTLHVYQDLNVPQTGTNKTVTRTFDFVYREDNYSFEVPVDTSLYTAAQTSPNKQLTFTSSEQGEFYRQMMTDPAMDAFYTDLVKELRRERYNKGLNLTDDEYLEMLISFVQQIKYDNTTSGNPRYPVEVIYDKMGDCDEKAILLNGILSREGYDVALLVFPTMKHATSGIRIHLPTNKPSFRVFSDGQRDYVYIETTRTRLIGFYSDEYETVPEPLVVPVGNGTLHYGKINYVMTIFADVKAIERQLRILEAKAGPSRTLSQDDYNAAMSYIKTYNFVGNTNDREAAMMTIRNSELRHNSVCLSCG